VGFDPLVDLAMAIIARSAYLALVESFIKTKSRPSFLKKL
jgi:large-conductance mechanosensitive channel